MKVAHRRIQSLLDVIYRLHDERTRMKCQILDMGSCYCLQLIIL